jgi:hypothetical protein
MAATEHTALPWRVRTLREDCFVEGNEIVGRSLAGEYKREILSDEEYPKKAADAAFIVQACNCHDDLVAACKTAMAEVSFMAEKLGNDHEMTVSFGLLKDALDRVAMGGAPDPDGEEGA